MNYDQIASVLRKLQSRFGWEPIMEGSNIIGVTFEGQSVTLEPGGQFELSGAPVETIHKTCAELNSHLYQVRKNNVWGRCGMCRRHGDGIVSKSGVSSCTTCLLCGMCYALASPSPPVLVALRVSQHAAHEGRVMD